MAAILALSIPSFTTHSTRPAEAAELSGADGRRRIDPFAVNNQRLRSMT
jgi:hypothetical protein